MIDIGVTKQYDRYILREFQEVLLTFHITRECDFVSSGKYLSDLSLYKSALYKITIF